MASGGQMIWYQMTLTQNNFIEFLFPCRVPHMKATSTISAVISPSTKQSYRFFLPSSLWEVTEFSEKDSGIGTPG